MIYMKKITIIISFFLIFLSLASAQSGKTKSYVVGFYNLENLFDTYDDPAKNDEEFLPDGANKWTEDKYRSSCERVGKAVLQYSSMPKMDVTNFLELLMFCWLTGNNDMHLKNFSIYEPAEGVFRLSPAYDLLNAAIVNPKDDEELALTLNGRKKNINMADFLKLAETLGIEAVTVRRLAEKFRRLLPKSEAIIDSSFVPEELKLRYKELLRERLARLR